MIDRERLRAGLPPRVRAADLWRVPKAFLEQAQDDATVLAVRAQERVGIDVVTDGEIRRESYSNRFATALEGLDLDRPGVVSGRSGRETTVPRVVGPVRRSRPVELRDVELLRAATDRPIRITLPGPFTMSQQAVDDYYGDGGSLAMALAEAVNEEVRDLAAAGADVVQIDEPWLQARPDQAREYALPAIDRALEGVPATTALHTCFGYGYVVADKPGGYPFLEELNGCAADEISLETAQPQLDLTILSALPDKTIVLGALDLHPSAPVETAEDVAGRIREALGYVAAERLLVGPDCGMKYLPRDVAYAKLAAMVAGARLVRDEIT